MGWDDPAYVEAKRARARAFADWCTVAAANPHKFDLAAHHAYYVANVEPLRVVFIQASDRLKAETERVQKELGL